MIRDRPISPGAKSPRLVWCAALAGMLVVSAGCHLRTPKQAFPENLVAFGDSITRGYAVPVGEGWVELLAHRMQAEDGPGRPGVSVFNAGGNANTSAEGMKRIERDVYPHLPGVVAIEFGGNDATHDARHVSVEQFELNLLTICRLVKERGGKPVLVTFPPVINAWHAFHGDSYYARWGGLDQCVEEYRQRTRAVARRMGYPLFDLDLLLRKKITATGPERWILRDGVHLTPQAHQFVAQEFMAFLRNRGFVDAADLRD
ncbi:MAG: multifunctional acyl-CoA thioesterase I/protease I/lysophospholipase [Verrucomicrobia bacterium]|nr:multifunctional acyl-CoA thioesterase I/protease I/lysophospholipase [Verrucomicrobiota bacterium]